MAGCPVPKGSQASCLLRARDGAQLDVHHDGMPRCSATHLLRKVRGEAEGHKQQEQSLASMCK
eukprot:4802131-Alexandrium_andersonii.AAC.1